MILGSEFAPAAREQPKNYRNYTVIIDLAGLFSLASELIDDNHE